MNRDPFLNDFVGDRASEAQLLLASLEKAPKDLPAHLRRRGRSWRPFDWPRRWMCTKKVQQDKLYVPHKKRKPKTRPRPKSDTPGAGALLAATTSDGDEQSEVRVRSHWRRPAALSVARTWANGRENAHLIGGQWLETHMWHTKRFHMESIWKFKLAARNNLLGRRALYRAATKHCAMHDRSYMQVFSINGVEAKIMSFLTAFGIDRKLLSSPSILNGSKRATTTFRASLGGPITAQIHLIWAPQGERKVASLGFTVDGEGDVAMSLGDSDSDGAGEDEASLDRRVLLFVHPSAADAVEEALRIPSNDSEGEEVRCQREEGLVFLEFFGPKSLETLARTIPPEACQGLSAKLWKELATASVGKRLTLPQGAVLSLIVNKKAVDTHATAKPSPVAGEVSATPPLDLVRTWPDEAFDSSRHFWKSIGEATPNESSEVVPILLIFRNSDPPGVDVLIPPRTIGHQLWIRANFASTRVLGFRDRTRLFSEYGIPEFPFDYFESPAGEALAITRANERRATAKRRPPAKRVNYGALGTACPYELDWHSLTAKDAGTAPASAATAATSPNAAETTTTAQNIATAATTSTSTTKATAATSTTMPTAATPTHPTPSSSSSALPSASVVRLGGPINVDESEVKRPLEVLRLSLPTLGTRPSSRTGLISVTIRCCGRGAPGELCQIFAPSPKDLAALIETAKAYSPPNAKPRSNHARAAAAPPAASQSCPNIPLLEWKRIRLLEPLHRNFKGRNGRHATKDVDARRIDVQALRPLVGFLTSGCYSHHLGRGVGCGAMTLEAFQQALQEQLQSSLLAALQGVTSGAPAPPPPANPNPTSPPSCRSLASSWILLWARNRSSRVYFPVWVAAAIHPEGLY